MDSSGYANRYDARPVGVFDSGFGGASLLRDALRLLPDERFIYYGDNKNAPYGDKSEQEITSLAKSAADFLMHRGVKALVVACNTATSAAIKALRTILDVPVVSVEPAIKPACMQSGNGKVLMLATEATTKLARYRALQSRMPNPERVINVGCSGLVERIEKGIVAKDAFDDILFNKLHPYEGMEIDGIVLGCTHFVFIEDAISRYAKSHFSGECRLYNGNAATARQLGRVLASNSIEAPPICSVAPYTPNPQPHTPDGITPIKLERVCFLTSGDWQSAYSIFCRLMGC